MNIKRRKITAAQDNNYKDNGGYAEYTSETKELYNSIAALYEKSCKVLSESAGPSVKLGEALEAMYDLFPRYGLDESALAEYESDVESATKITAGRRDSGVAVNIAREVYSELCDAHFKATIGANAPFSPDGAPMYHLTKAIEAIDDIYAFGLSDEDREEMSEDIEGACGKKKAVKGSDDDKYNVVLEEEYGPYTGTRVLHKGLDKASAKSAQRHYSKNAPMNQSYYMVDDDELARSKKRSIRSSTKASKSIKCATDSLSQQVYEFLDEQGTYTDYDDKIQSLIEEFGLSEKDAEGYVWNWSSGLHKLQDGYEGPEDYVESDTEGTVEIAVDGEYARSFGPSILQEQIEARLSGPVDVYSVEIGDNLTIVYFEITDPEDYSIEEAQYDIERAFDDIIYLGEEPEDGSSLDDATYMDMGYNQYS